MDPSGTCVAPDSGGSSSSNSDGNGGRSVDTSPRRCHLMPTSPAGNGAADGGGPKPSPASRDLEPDHSRHRVNPEDLPTPHQVQRVLLDSPVHSPAAMDDDVLIMDGMLIDNGPGTTSSARRSVSFVDNRRSVSISDLMLVSSGSRGGGSGSRRSGFSGEFDPTGDREEPRGTQSQENRYSEASSNRRRAQGADPSNVQQGQQGADPSNVQHGQQGAGPSNVQQGQQFPLNHNVQQWQQFPLNHGVHFQPGQQLPLNYNIQQPQWYWHPFIVPPLPLPGYTFAPDRVTIPSSHYNPPVDIRHPDGTPLSLPPPKRSESRAPIVIRAPPTNKGGTSAPEQPESQATPPAPEQPVAHATPEQPETQATLPAPEQPETQQQPPPPAPQAPPAVDEEYAIWSALYGPRTRPRLPVFRDICPDDTEGLPPPPPPPSAPPSQ